MPVRFVHVTDTHYHPAAPRDFAPPKLLTRGSEILAASVPAINAVAPDFIVHGGDLLCGGSSFEIPRDQYERSLRDVAGAYAGFAAPIHYVAGNHDCDAQDYGYAAFLETFGVGRTLDIVDVAPRLRLALANIYRDGEADAGTWTAELDDALRDADAQARGDRAALFLVLHSWVHPGAAADPTRGIINNAAGVQETLAACDTVAAVFGGHRHANRVRLFRDYLCVDTACLIGYPLGFRELTVDDEGWLTSRWHTLDLPDVLDAASQLGDEEQRHRWAGEFGDRDTTVLLPRAQRLWHG